MAAEWRAEKKRMGSRKKGVTRKQCLPFTLHGNCRQSGSQRMREDKKAFPHWGKKQVRESCKGRFAVRWCAEDPDY